MKTALITGIAGQDGSYLADLLLEKGYRVAGITRPGSAAAPRLAHIATRIELHAADLSGATAVRDVIARVKPDEIYNLAAESFVPAQPAHAADLAAIGVLRLLDAIREAAPGARFFQASSSEIFGNAPESPQSETTPFRPRTPYGAAKLYGHNITGIYRQTFGLHASSGILYNHESPRRGADFVTRKITRHVGLIRHGRATELKLGDLSARRDWGFAGDYVRAMWLMLQQDKADDYVIATGETHTVRELVEIAFGRAQLDWSKHVVVDPAFVRPAEPVVLCGDASKARARLGWKPEVGFASLVHAMVDADLATVAAPT